MEATVIDWVDRKSHLLLNPRLPAADRERLVAIHRKAPPLDSHVWLATSGSVAGPRLVGLSKEAILHSAAAVNDALSAARGEGWCRVLPLFHIGGFAIHARAYLTGSPVMEMEWSAERFVEACSGHRIRYASLVPAQLHDLVSHRLGPPAPLKRAILGGGIVTEALYKDAVLLGWPLMLTYGMTECSSQVATSEAAGNEYTLLSHVTARQEGERIALSSPALLTGYCDDSGFHDPKQDGWFVTDDLGDVEGRRLRVRGRAAEVVKVGGETVDLQRLDAILAECKGGSDCALFAAADTRLGAVVHLATTADDASATVDEFNRRVAPFERVRAVQRVAAIPRSPLGKLLRPLLAEWVSTNNPRSTSHLQEVERAEPDGDEPTE